MTLGAFVPVLWVLSDKLTGLPVIGAVPHSLVWVALFWALGGTVLLAVVGVRLPGLEFHNQRVEAAYRKELVLGEDDHARAAPPRPPPRCSPTCAATTSGCSSTTCTSTW